ncbi:YhfC family glutamic-type intramembrane protease [Granulicoccus sp. GXG6511]|uniref:YhfC family glutamic-type intramembrane protease n=1 Tax=Granulicoccus sp. GXG6511 TaxID=3381351 RepID=UPI003D7C587A
MLPSDVSGSGLIAVGLVALLCLLGPLLVQIFWARGRRWLWAGFGLGVLTFTVTQLLIRIPLITVVLPVLPEWQALLSHAVWAALVLSFSAAVFEETGRLLVLTLFFRTRRRTQADGVAFGLGHGGIEAFVLVGLSLVGVLVMGILVKAGQWGSLTATMPPEAAAALQSQLGAVTVLAATAGGLERVAAVALHVGLSVLVLLGVERGRPVAAWLLAMLIHGVANFVAVVALTVWGWPVLAVEALLLVVAAIAIAWVVRIRPAFASGAGDRGDESPGESDQVARGEL